MFTLCKLLVLLVQILQYLGSATEENEPERNNTLQKIETLETDGNIGVENNDSANMEGFVVGGQYASIDSFPHSVFLTAFCSPDDETFWICGSSVLNQKILLTAAHCLYGCVKNFHIDAIAGTSNVDNVNVLRQVKRYIIHERYDSYTDYCDIAVAMLNGNLPLGSKIRRVILRPSFALGSQGQVAGWGVVSDTHAETSRLKKVSQVVRPPSSCRHINLRPGMMCASSPSSTRDYPAVGDSGSALITSTFQQIGLVSFKSRSKAANMIVYTNISHFYDWIQIKALRLYCFKG